MAKKKQVAGKKGVKKVADTKNKGEWGERYCFPKIIHTQQIRFGDKNLNIPDTNNFITISKLTTADLQQSFLLKPNSPWVTVTKDGGNPKRINWAKIINENTLNDIISKIKKEETRKGAFELPAWKTMETKLGIDNMKGGTSSQKADIFLDIEYDGTKKKDVGFSIKSGFGASPTLLNASGQTHFVYEVTGLPANHIDAVNSIVVGSKVVKRVNKIKELGGSFNFLKNSSITFGESLSTVNKIIPELVAKMFIHSYMNGGRPIHSNLKNLWDSGDLINFTGETLASLTVKVKKLMSAVLLGIFPETKWDGNFKAQGLIIVKENGELVCFHVDDINMLEDFLFENVSFETASTTRWKFGELYKDNKNKIYFNIALQLRLGNPSKSKI